MKNHKDWRPKILWLLLSLLCLNATTGSNENPIRKKKLKSTDDLFRKDYSSDCFRVGCHNQLGQKNWVHGPVAVGSCKSCHEDKGVKNDHKFKLIRQGRDLCLYCHKIKSSDTLQHEAVLDSACTKCHDPHGGFSRSLLKSPVEADFCGDCHSRTHPESPLGKGLNKKWEGVHEPVEKGKCLTCHEGHRSKYKGLLVKPEKDLCLGCHLEIDSIVVSSKHVHEPIEKKCTDCHFPHSGEKNILRAKIKPLCLDCHDEVDKAIQNNPRVHEGITKSESCLDCHVPHAGDADKLVKSPISKSCYDCHSKEIKRKSGKKIPSILKQVEEGLSIHKPVKEGKCADCHKGHISKHQKLLTGRFPNTDYVKFSVNQYALCLDNCHEPEMVTRLKYSETEFRDGDWNLHYLHVNKSKSRNCSFCHQPHASPLPMLTQVSVNFGPSNWPLKLNYKKSAKGGSCMSACHKRKKYDRTKAVNNWRKILSDKKKK